MRAVKEKRRLPVGKRVKTEANRKRESFRDLKAFGLWADRTDVKDAVEFTKELRTRIEHGNDGR